MFESPALRILYALVAQLDRAQRYERWSAGGSSPSRCTISWRCGQIGKVGKFKPCVNILSVRLRPSLPFLESKAFRVLSLPAKQMEREIVWCSSHLLSAIFVAVVQVAEHCVGITEVMVSITIGDSNFICSLGVTHSTRIF